MLAGGPKLKPEDVVQSSHQKHDLAPMGVFLVKGWTRSVAAMCIMLCAFESEDFLQAGLIYCSLNWVYHFDNLLAQAMPDEIKRHQPHFELSTLTLAFP